MKSIIITFMFVAFLSLFCCAQVNESKDIEVKKDILNYFICNSNVSIITYKVHNKSNETIWLWIQKDALPKATDSVKIQEYFFRKKAKSDSNFYQLGMDRNIEVFVPSIFDTFVKCILPNKYFSVQVITKDSISEFTKQKIFKYFDNHIVFFPEQNILKVIPSLNEMNPMIFFKEDFVTLYSDFLISTIRN